jgi:hypothetical protein
VSGCYKSAIYPAAFTAKHVNKYWPCFVAELWVTAEAISTNAGWEWTAYSCVCNVFFWFLKGPKRDPEWCPERDPEWGPD